MNDKEKLQRDIGNMESGLRINQRKIDHYTDQLKLADEAISSYTSVKAANERTLKALQAELAALEKPAVKCDEWWIAECQNEDARDLVFKTRPCMETYPLAFRVTVPPTEADLRKRLREVVFNPTEELTAIIKVLNDLGIPQEGGK